MNVKILSNNDFSNINKLKKEFDVFRVIKTETGKKLHMIELFNKDGVFRGFGRDTKAAYKKAKKVIKKYYK